VSPLWRDEIGAFLGPRGIVLARMQRGIRPKCALENHVSLEPARGGDWEPAVDAFRQQLEDARWHNANLRLVISDSWAHYALLPWSPELGRDAERLAHARLILSKTHGERVDEWTVSVSEAWPGSPSIVSALPTALIGELQSISAACKLKLVSLQPHLIVAYNGWRKNLGKATSWFALVDDGLLSAMHLTDGRCDGIRSVRCSADWDVEMQRMQSVWRLARGHSAAGPVYADVPLRLRKKTVSENDDLVFLDARRPPQNAGDRVSMLKAGAL
jgi:hypothetical protein